MAGFTPVASVEIMDAAVETYKYNFIEQKGFNETVETRDIREEEVKQKLYDEIGERLGKRDRTTVMHGYNKIEEDLATDVSLQNEIDILMKIINHQ